MIGYDCGMSEVPFHHGNLRTVLLDHAEQALRTKGVEELSLRQLAREIGVSHGAPRSHFIDRKALLDALAERGFLALASDMRAGANSRTEYVESLRAAGQAYVDFAVANAALLDLMFAATADQPPATLLAAAEDLFSTISDVMQAGVEAGVFRDAQIERLTLLMSATMRGISTFVSAGRVLPAGSDQLIDDAIALFLGRPIE